MEQDSSYIQFDNSSEEEDFAEYIKRKTSHSAERSILSSHHSSKMNSNKKKKRSAIDNVLQSSNNKSLNESSLSSRKKQKIKSNNSLSNALAMMEGGLRGSSTDAKSNILSLEKESTASHRKRKTPNLKHLVGNVPSSLMQDENEDVHQPIMKRNATSSHHKRSSNELVDASNCELKSTSKSIRSSHHVNKTRNLDVVVKSPLMTSPLGMMTSSLDMKRKEHYNSPSFMYSPSYSTSPHARKVTPPTTSSVPSHVKKSLEFPPVPPVDKNDKEDIANKETNYAMEEDYVGMKTRSRSKEPKVDASKEKEKENSTKSTKKEKKEKEKKVAKEKSKKSEKTKKSKEEEEVSTTTSESVFECSFCHQNFHGKVQYINHMILQHHEISSRSKHLCALCDQRVKDLIGHLSQHHRDINSSINNNNNNNNSENSLEKIPRILRQLSNLSAKTLDPVEPYVYTPIARPVTELIIKSPRPHLNSGRLSLTGHRGSDLSDMLWDFVLSVDCPEHYGASSRQNGLICTACSGRIDATHSTAVLPCLHLFHVDCVSNRSSEPSCPTCKKENSTNILVKNKKKVSKSGKKKDDEILVGNDEMSGMDVSDEIVDIRFEDDELEDVDVEQVDEETESKKSKKHKKKKKKKSKKKSSS